MMMGKAIDIGSYDDYLKKEAEKRVFEEISKQERLQNIKFKMEKIICDNYLGHKLNNIQLYKDAIYSYIVSNGKKDLENNENDLLSFINIYYKKLKHEEISITELIILQNMLGNQENEIANDIKRIYNNSKEILIDIATKRVGTIGEDEINMMVDKLIEEHKKNTFYIKRDSLNNLEELNLAKSIATVLYLQDNTNLDLNPHLPSKKLKLRCRK